MNALSSILGWWCRCSWFVNFDSCALWHCYVWFVHVCIHRLVLRHTAFDFFWYCPLTHWCLVSGRARVAPVAWSSCSSIVLL